jgi:hypothetical protein
MPLKRDPNGGGTNADGTMSVMYCSKCFVSGAFLNPEIDTAQKMQMFVKEKLAEMGFPRFLAGLFTRGIPKLSRWKK